jgi:O-Antigen ligase
MSALRARPRALSADRTIGQLAIALGAGVVAVLAARKVGIAGLAAPVALALLVAVFLRPVVAVGLTVTLAILCEGPSFGISATAELYRNLYSGLEPLDFLVMIAFFSVGFDLLRRRRQPRLPATPALALVLVVLAGVSGVAVGWGAGVSLKEAALSVHVLPFLIMMPLAVYNLDLDTAQLVTAVRWLLVSVGIKAMAGLIVMAMGLSADLDTGTTITYYEPTANWLIMLGILGLLGAGLGGALRPEFSRGRAPRGFPAGGRRSAGTVRRILERWGGRVNGRLLLLGLPLPIACLLLSYRRSFWIATVVGVLLVFALASTPRKRVMVVVTVLAIAGGVFAVGVTPFQSQSPIVQRVQSLSPSNLTTNAQDRYRLDERANVIAEIKQSPVGGLGADVPWVAIARPLGLEHVGGRLYVHFALLWWWLKLGVLGAGTYIALLVSMALLGFRTWRRHSIPELRYFGLASMCAVAGLVAIETTATFTGVDARFTVIVGAQLGLLAAMAQKSSRGYPARSRSAAADQPSAASSMTPAISA